MENYVSYDCAVKLKELGFDVKCRHFYNINTQKFLRDRSKFNYNLDYTKCSAPRLDQAQKWLREVKGIDVLVFNCSCGYGWEISKSDPQSRGTGILMYDGEGEDENSGMWLSYEKALSAGIVRVLTYLQDKK